MKETGLIIEVNSQTVVFLRMSFKAQTSELKGFDREVFLEFEDLIVKA